MAANRQQPLRHGKIAIAQCPADDRVGSQTGLQLAPYGDALKQGAGHVMARHAKRQRCIHVEMRIDKWRRKQIALGVDHRPRL